ncbi:ricin-type beta-trefoil lectin domain protein [Saccharothrix sp. NRRL B-16314]|uniref:ricin-type beta-trefoil lectin domain protein n=1 Tax=Saccharothrix sp. NRRL B-16314 TaxID=1463825 RepID=UPI0005250653|nr:ricin-type beta-trefoil lectin domain protein [Saccharothrix sp. NRRL B-16314]
MKLKANLRRLTSAGAAIAFGSTLLVGVATSAQAGQTAQAVYYQVRNANSTNSCLQVNITAGKGNLVLGNCDRSAKQVWTIVDRVWRNPVSNHCLDGNGADVYTFACNGGSYQLYNTSSGSPKYILHELSGKYLHARGFIGEEVVYAPSISTTSRWVIEQVGTG